MKNIIKVFSFTALLLMGTVACENFLDRPNEDSYNVNNFYQTNEQCIQAANPLYNSPWYDFQRGFFKVGEVLAGNFYWGDSPYLTFTLKGDDGDLDNIASSLWTVNATCNTVIENIANNVGPAVSEEVKAQVKGEAIAWKAMAYFYLVRTFGEIPIVHDNSADIASGQYNDKYKATLANVYDYIIMNLETAEALLPWQNAPGRIDKYTAYGLLAKVYLTKAGVTGTLNNADLQNAAKYAKIIIDHPEAHGLEPVYSDVFRLSHNFTTESLLSWQWKAGRDPWTQQNTLQSDLAVANFSEFADSWGGYIGPSVDLQDAFGENALSPTRIGSDVRRKATMMMWNDHYDYFWTDKGGFDWNDHILNTLKEVSSVGANAVKHLVGDSYDHEAQGGGSMDNMATGLSTHLLRVADIYLIYAEAMALQNGGVNGSTSDPTALDVFYQVRHRAIASSVPPVSLTWTDIWKERRLELACEGDRWYDYVRLHYFEPTKAINEIKAQRRSTYDSDKLLTYYQGTGNPPEYDPQAAAKIPNVTDASFKIPFPVSDLAMNPHLLEPPQNIDISQFTY
jgi:hypothetical protein